MTDELTYVSHHYFGMYFDEDYFDVPTVAEWLDEEMMAVVASVDELVAA